jgi:hypothetical protein
VESVVFKTGDDVEMDMGNDLSGDFAIGLADVDAVGLQGDELGPDDFLNDADQVLEQREGQGGQGIEVRFGDHEGMSFDNRPDIHESKGVGILINPATGKGACNDAAKHAIWVHTGYSSKNRLYNSFPVGIRQARYDPTFMCLIGKFRRYVCLCRLHSLNLSDVINPKGLIIGCRHDSSGKRS